MTTGGYRRLKFRFHVVVVYTDTQISNFATEYLREDNKFRKTVLACFCPKEGRKSPDTDPLSEQFPWRRFVSDPWPEPLMMATLKSAALSPTVHDQAGGGGADEPAAPPHQPQDLSHQDCPGRAAAAPGQRYLGVTP